MSLKIVVLVEIRKKLRESWLVFVLRLKGSRRMSQILIQSRRWYFAKIFLYILCFKHLILALSLVFFQERELEKSNSIEKILDNQKIPGDVCDSIRSRFTLRYWH